jgi:hypothetical protein
MNHLFPQLHILMDEQFRRRLREAGSALGTGILQVALQEPLFLHSHPSGMDPPPSHPDTQPCMHIIIPVFP